VQYEYSYLYEYYPDVSICNDNRLLIAGRILSIVSLGGAGSRSSRGSSSQIRVILKRSGCSGYFLADGDSGGIYLLQWISGYEPNEGDIIAGELRSYGYRDVFYPQSGRNGRVYVDNYMLSRTSAAEAMQRKCR
jgi:hypothetical protein